MFADDTTVYLDGSEKSFTETIVTLDHFAEISGLRINNEKTQIIWIGNRKNSQCRYFRDRNFQWNPGIFKVLGIHFSTDLDSIPDLNFEGKLTELKTEMCKWKKRKLTPFGKKYSYEISHHI